MIRNVTKDTILTERIEYADTFFRRLVGLMFSDPEDRGLVFTYSYEQYISLHMFFVFYCIDVLWLNSQGEVVFLKEEFRPFTVVFPSEKARSAIELPSGTILRSRTAIGDRIEVIL
jgi:uncharacterized membrane protein (UPF0127 family)